MPKLSVILITRNEAHNIVGALESTRFADEWIVVDSGSSDDTVPRAIQWGAAVYMHADWPGFGPQKNRALGYATGDWVLALDADERVSPELAAEIQQAVADPNAAAGYTLPVLSMFCGRFMRHGSWWPNNDLRLFRRANSSFTNVLVHEGVRITGEIRALKGCLLHYPRPSLEVAIEKMNAYSTASAAAFKQRNKPGGLIRGILRAMFTFLKLYVLRVGFLDGRQGFLAAFSAAEVTFYRYAKLWLLYQESSSQASQQDSPAAAAQTQKSAA